MSEELAAPSLPTGSDFSRATFEQAVFAVTGMGLDIHAVVDRGESIDNGWFKMAGAGKESENPEAATATAGNYFAYAEWHYGVNYNTQLFTDWDTVVADMNSLIPPLSTGRLGLMDVQQLRNAKALVDKYVTWLDTNRAVAQNWVASLDSEDSAFRGTAAYAVQANLKRIVFMLNDLETQLQRQRNPTPSHALGQMADALGEFGWAMAWAWQLYNLSTAGDALRTATKFVTDSIHEYIWGMGLVKGTPNYNLDDIATGEEGKKFVAESLDNFSSATTEGPLYTQKDVGDIVTMEEAFEVIDNPRGTAGTYPINVVQPPDGMSHISGDLRSKDTWNSINKAVSDYVRGRLAPLDQYAQQAISHLSTVYGNAQEPLAPVLTNNPPNLGTAPGGPGGPPPDGGVGDFDLPPSGGNGDDGLGGLKDFLPPPDGGLKDFSPPPDGFGGLNDFPSPDGLGGPDGPGGLEDFSPSPDGLGGLNDFPPPPGNGENDPFGNPTPFVPTPFGPPGSDRNPDGRSNTDRLPNFDQPFPDLDGPPFDRDDQGDGWSPPGPDDIKLPPLSPDTPTVPDLTDPGGTANVNPPPSPGGAELPGGSAGGADLPGGGPDGALSPEGTGFGGAGEGWADWSGDLGVDNNGEQNGPTATNQGGMMPPMMPPMGGMGGMGGSGTGRNERERETWLSEDEKVWGAGSVVGRGVVGRPADGERVVDEPLAPTHVRAAAHHGRVRDKKRHPVESAESAESTESTESAESPGGSGAEAVSKSAGPSASA